MLILYYDTLNGRGVFNLNIVLYSMFYLIVNIVLESCREYIYEKHLMVVGFLT